MDLSRLTNAFGKCHKSLDDVKITLSELEETIKSQNGMLLEIRKDMIKKYGAITQEGIPYGRNEEYIINDEIVDKEGYLKWKRQLIIDKL